MSKGFSMSFEWNQYNWFLVYYRRVRYGVEQPWGVVYAKESYYIPSWLKYKSWDKNEPEKWYSIKRIWRFYFFKYTHPAFVDKS